MLKTKFSAMKRLIIRIFLICTFLFVVMASNPAKARTVGDWDYVYYANQRPNQILPVEDQWPQIGRAHV